MWAALAAAVSAFTMWLWPPATDVVLLRYRPAPGQVAVYHVTSQVTGWQELGSARQPVGVQVTLELAEEVAKVEADGSFWLRVRGRVLAVADPSGTFGVGERADFPDLELRLSSLGEVMEVRLPAGQHLGPFQRAFSTILSAVPAPVLFPPGPVRPGEEWECVHRESRQRNRLDRVGSTWPATAQLVSWLRVPLDLTESGAELGVTWRMSGELSARREVELLLGSGLTRREVGEAHLQTSGEAMLASAQDVPALPARADLHLSYRSELAAASGSARRGQ